MLQEKRPESMRHLEDANKAIPIAELNMWQTNVRTGGFYINVLKGDSQERLHCQKAIPILSNFYYWIGQRFSELGRDPLAGEVVAYLHAIRNAIEQHSPITAENADAATSLSLAMSQSVSLGSLHSFNDELATIPGEPGFRPKPFETHPFCSPLSLNGNDLTVTRIRNKVLMSRAPQTILEHVFLGSLQILQEQQSQFMELLKDADSIIPTIELDTCLNTLEPQNVCSRMNLRDTQGNTNCLDASATMHSCLVEIKERSDSLFGGSLPAYQFVTYLHAMHETIMHRDNTPTEDVRVIAKIMDLVTNYSRASREALEFVLLASLEMPLEGGETNLMSILKDRNAIIPITEVVGRLNSMKFDTKHDNSDNMEAKSTLSNLFTAFENKVYQSDVILPSVDQFIAHIDYLLEIVEGRRPLPTKEDPSLSTTKAVTDLVISSKASREALEHVLWASLEMSLEGEINLLTLLEDSNTIIPITEVFKRLNSMDLSTLYPNDNNHARNYPADYRKARAVISRAYSMMMGVSTRTSVTAGELDTFIRAMKKAIGDGSQISYS